MSMQSGTVVVGSHSSGPKQFFFKFKSPFPTPPVVVVTARQDPTIAVNTIPDTFAITVTDVSIYACEVNIVRCDQVVPYDASTGPGGIQRLPPLVPGWGQQLQLNWVAASDD